ncbi:ABC transporter permease [Anaeromicropila populeti]|uniref:Putative ABC transport system permease protein n=1 Tax=Anaeromicropila populeti TaxID=37658 RepID=A0A1I6IN17_9FIRM|nr:ABC transporter permease [Anaeromicropila populeti]SFR67680.1 putative ABC transport system permease protein [Anaeromicropila populeti]
MNIDIILGAAELGLVYSLLSLGLFVTFRILNIPDMTVDGTFVLGAAISVIFCIWGHPVLALLIAFVGGGIIGSITAILYLRFKITPILAGILVMLSLYSINLRIMSYKPNLSLTDEKTIFSEIVNDRLLILFIVILVYTLIAFFFKTRMGVSLRATGMNAAMANSQSINANFMKMTGFALGNGLVALSGGILAQQQEFVDVNMGTGMVVIGLASIVIGEVLVKAESTTMKIISALIGSIVYRLFISLALQIGMRPTDLKLVSALIVIIAISVSNVVGKKNVEVR